MTVIWAPLFDELIKNNQIMVELAQKGIIFHDLSKN